MARRPRKALCTRECSGWSGYACDAHPADAIGERSGEDTNRDEGGAEQQVGNVHADSSRGSLGANRVPGAHFWSALILGHRL